LSISTLRSVFSRRGTIFDFWISRLGRITATMGQHRVVVAFEKLWTSREARGNIVGSGGNSERARIVARSWDRSCKQCLRTGGSPG
jgi:hypothetical protein